MSDSEDQDEKEKPVSAADLEASGQTAMFGGGEETANRQELASSSGEAAAGQAVQPVSGETTNADTVQPYRVLARKYRPQSFDALIGQEAMVQTLANAIKRDRLAHAFLMTGVRGIGKTSTARLIAKALNCIGPDGQGGATIHPCGQCEPCLAITQGRHIDVIEMDAASHTGVDDVREIIEAVRYAAVSARYKIYIIDEVHMLSKNAFNALLKTLEEPPAHVKFIFATTEVDKLPITVLSRCQRFDLKRISAEQLTDHFADICEKEGVDAQRDALALIARAADGSVRDGLSILDQAIAHGDMVSDGNAPQIGTEQVREMLGLCDRSAIYGLFDALLVGDAEALLAAAQAQHVLGVEPVHLVQGMMDVVHAITLRKIGRTNSALGDDRLVDFASAFSHAQLHRLWQMLLTGYGEIQSAPEPKDACDMTLLRLLYAQDLPDPGDLARQISLAGSSSTLHHVSDTASTSGGKSQSDNDAVAVMEHQGQAELAPPTQAPPARQQAPGPQDDAPLNQGDASLNQGDASLNQGDAVPQFADLVRQVEQGGRLRLYQFMHDDMRIIEFAPGRIIYTLRNGRNTNMEPELRDALLQMTGQRWTVEQRQGDASPSLAEQAQAMKQKETDKLMDSPLVKAALAAFPDAQIIEDDEAGNSNYYRSAQA